MGVFKRDGSKYWWYKFVWDGEEIRESTKQTNKRVAEQMEAARRTALAKGEVGIRDKVAVPTVAEFATGDFIKYHETRFANKPNTLAYYRNGVKNLSESALAKCALDSVTADKIAAFITALRSRDLSVASINRQLEVLRRMLKLAVEWGRVEKVLPKVEMLSGENRRERVLSAEEESRYLTAVASLAANRQESYERALKGIRATTRGEVPTEPDPYLLRDVAALLIDCGLRPDEAFRLRWDHVRDRAVNIPYGKTENARRTIPLTPRTEAYLDMRRSSADGPWVFPAPTKSGHIEKSSLKKQHAAACVRAGVVAFVLYTFRHTCLTRWAAVMDPYTLAYLAGHSDFSTTKRYVHPQAETVRAAMERVRAAHTGYNFGYTDLREDVQERAETEGKSLEVNGINGRGERIRTSDLLVPNQAL